MHISLSNDSRPGPCSLTYLPEWFQRSITAFALGAISTSGFINEIVNADTKNIQHFLQPAAYGTWTLSTLLTLGPSNRVLNCSLSITHVLTGSIFIASIITTHDQQSRTQQVATITLAVAHLTHSIMPIVRGKKSTTEAHTSTNVSGSSRTTTLISSESNQQHEVMKSMAKVTVVKLIVHSSFLIMILGLILSISDDMSQSKKAPHSNNNTNHHKGLVHVLNTASLIAKSIGGIFISLLWHIFMQTTSTITTHDNETDTTDETSSITREPRTTTHSNYHSITHADNHTTPITECNEKTNRGEENGNSARNYSIQSGVHQTIPE